MSSNPAIDILNNELKSLAEKIDFQAEVLKNLKAKKKAIEDALQQLGAAAEPTATATEEPEQGKTLTSMIIDHLRARPGTTPGEIAKRITEEGRKTNNTTVSSLLTRMRRKGRAQRRKGKWYAGPQALANEGSTELSAETPVKH